MELIIDENDVKTRCPDCNALVHVPITIEHHELIERLTTAGETSDVMDEEKFHDVMKTHVMLNPEIHPSFVVKSCNHLTCAIIRKFITFFDFIDRLRGKA